MLGHDRAALPISTIVEGHPKSACLEVQSRHSAIRCTQRRKSEQAVSLTSMTAQADELTSLLRKRIS